MNDEETVALVAGGHTFGKAHGAGNPKLVGTCRLVPGAEIPRTAEGSIEWLETQWERVDAWVAAYSGGQPEKRAGGCARRHGRPDVGPR